MYGQRGEGTRDREAIITQPMTHPFAQHISEPDLVHCNPSRLRKLSAAVVEGARPACADGNLVAVARVHDSVVGALPLAVRLRDVDAGSGAEGEGQKH